MAFIQQQGGSCARGWTYPLMACGQHSGNCRTAVLLVQGMGGVGQEVWQGLQVVLGPTACGYSQRWVP